MNTTSTTTSSEERKQQPIVTLTAYFYPSELQPAKEMLEEMMDKVYAHKPVKAEHWGALCTLMGAVKDVMKTVDSANSKAGA